LGTDLPTRFFRGDVLQLGLGVAKPAIDLQQPRDIRVDALVPGRLNEEVGMVADELDIDHSQSSCQLTVVS
jgi:hypothetical protein